MRLGAKASEVIADDDDVVVLHEHSEDHLVGVDIADSIACALWGPDRDRAIDVTECVQKMLRAGGKVFASIQNFEDVAPRTKKLLKIWFQKPEADEHDEQRNQEDLEVRGYGELEGGGGASDEQESADVRGRHSDNAQP